MYNRRGIRRGGVAGRRDDNDGRKEKESVKRMRQTLRQIKTTALLAATLAAAACARPSAPVEDKSPGDIAVARIEGKSSPAVVALLRESRAQLRAKDNTGAVRAVERALRLEPKNPQLWHQLALIRYEEKNWQQAITLAQKSNSLSGQRRDLQKANEALITRANRHLQLGD